MYRGFFLFHFIALCILFLLNLPLNLNELKVLSMSYLFMCVSTDWQGTTGPRETYATTVTLKMMMMSKRL